MNWIDESVAVGNLLDSKNEELLKKEKIDLVIDVRPFYRGVKSATMRILREVANLIIIASQKHRILLHCLGGIDRSPFLAAIYFHLKYNVSLNRAYRMISERRPETFEHPEWVKAFQELDGELLGKNIDWYGFWLWLLKKAKEVWVYEKDKRTVISHLDSWLKYKEEEWKKLFL